MVLRRQAFTTVAVMATAIFAGCFGGSDEGGAPTAMFTVTPKAGDPLTYVFDATNSTDPGGDDLVLHWNFGDGQEIHTGPMQEFGIVEYTFAYTDTQFWTSLIVTDPDGNAASDLKMVSLGTGNNTRPEIMARNATRWVKPGTGIVLDVSQSKDVNDDLFNYEWMVGNYSADNVTVDTGYLSNGESYNVTLDKAGVYQFHCHPHPWMRSRVIVNGDDPNATTGGAVIDIQYFDYSERALVVAPGTKVTWRNLDPTEHTATLEWFAPGTVVGTGPILSTKLPVGDYQARLVLDDLKGGHATRAWGLKVSADAPDSPKLDYFNHTAGDARNVPTASPFASDGTKELAYKPEWPGNVTGTVTWTDEGGQNSWRLHLVQTGKIIAHCTPDGTSCTFQANVSPGNYELWLSVTGPNLNSAIEVTVAATQWTFPPFGDSDPASICPPGWDLHGGVCMKH